MLSFEGFNGFCVIFVGGDFFDPFVKVDARSFAGVGHDRSDWALCLFVIDLVEIDDLVFTDHLQEQGPIVA